MEGRISLPTFSCALRHHHSCLTHANKHSLTRVQRVSHRDIIQKVFTSLRRARALFKMSPRIYIVIMLHQCGGSRENTQDVNSAVGWHFKASYTARKGTNAFKRRRCLIGMLFFFFFLLAHHISHLGVHVCWGKFFQFGATAPRARSHWLSVHGIPACQLRFPPSDKCPTKCDNFGALFRIYFCLVTI